MFTERIAARKMAEAGVDSEEDDPDRFDGSDIGAVQQLLPLK